MKRRQARSWGVAVTLFAAVGCGSSGGNKTGAGGAGAAATGGGGGTATSMRTTLLVDFDGSDNNLDPTDPTATPSPSDTLFPTLLQAESVGYDILVIPSGTTVDSPTGSALSGYSAVVWYTADMDGQNGTLSAGQEAVVEAWLDHGQKTLLVFSEQLVQALGKDDWTTPETNAFLSNYVGAAGDAVDNLADMTYDAKGAAGTPFAGQTFHVVADAPISSTADEVNPKAGTETLVTVMDDPDGSGTARAVPVIVGRKHVGAAGTSTVVYVGMPIENVQVIANDNTAGQLFHAVLVFAGLASP
jgi:hypothetical protein